ncbi:MAG TPA: hypothetical protein VMU12_00355 [Candidatus Paceibacterota bacterium]|nr:hypothetical protein [Candidatus Paceibacterota bacterium]
MKIPSRQELVSEFERLFGVRPVPPTGGVSQVQRALEQTIVNNELMDVRHQLSRTQGEEARVLRLKLELMIDVARKLGFRTEPV